MNTGENQIDFDNDQAPLKKDTLQGTGQAKAVRGSMGQQRKEGEGGDFSSNKGLSIQITW